MPLTPKSTFCKNINELQEQDYEVNEKMIMFLITYQTQQLSNTPQHTSLYIGMVFIRVGLHRFVFKLQVLLTAEKN